MHDYFISGVYFKSPQLVKPNFTDFSDFPACFDALQESLLHRPQDHMAMQFELMHDNVEDNELITIRYGYSGTPGCLVASLVNDEEGLLTDGYLLGIDQETSKIRMIPREGHPQDDALDDAIKIIQEYGMTVIAGIQWGAYFLHEHAEGRLKQHFESKNQEIH